MTCSVALFAFVTLGSLAVAGCSSEPAAPTGASGGAATGGALGTGGAPVTGGTSTGGLLASGGTSTGGNQSFTGGNVNSTGGSPGNTGGATGGSTSNGGSAGAGASGGTTSAGKGSGGSVGGAGGASGGSSGTSAGGSGTGGSAGGGAGSGGTAGGVTAGSGNAGNAGNAGSGGHAGGSTSPAASLDKFRFECPCKAGATNHTNDGNCNVTPETDRQTIVKTMGGDPSKVYDVTLRVRGLSEPNTYKNGMLQGERFYIGGTTNTAGYTSYMMTTADPAQHYFFNYSPTTGHVHFKLDYQVTVKIRGGSRVTFDVDGDGSIPDGHQVSNFDQTVVPDVPPAPMAYDGQFIQLDVVSAVAAP